MSAKLTDAQLRCLTWYEENRATNAVIPGDAKWNMRQVERLLDLDMLEVGPGGWHVPSEAGRAALGFQPPVSVPAAREGR
jgi:hypothetical protein